MNTSDAPNDSAALSKVSLPDRTAESRTSALPERTEVLLDHLSAVQQTVREVARLKADIEKLRPLDPDVEARIMEAFRLSWNYHSNAIEGNTLSLGETKTFLKHGLTAKGKPFKDYLDIEGHDEALDYLAEFVNSERPLTQAVIRELHRILLVEPYPVKARTPSGEKATKQVAIGTYKTTPNHVRTVTGKLHRYASPEETPARMRDLMDWYRAAETNGDLHPLAVAALFHHEFTAIHPFDDGNGRMARLLTNLMLMRHGYPPLVVKQERKEEYFYALAAADEGDVAELVVFFGEALIESMQLYLRGARGESIDELSDFDKRLALLEQRLTTKEDEAEQTKTREAQMKVFNEFIEPLLTKLNRRYEKIDRLFSRSQQIRSYTTPSGRGHIFASTRRGIVRELTSAFEDEEVSQFKLFEKWEGLRSHASKDLLVKHEFNLGRTDFTAEIERTPFSSTYDEPILEEQVTVFASEVLKKVFERLESLSSNRNS